MSIFEHGAHFSPGETVDPSISPALREAGVALVTTYIEQLIFTHTHVRSLAMEREAQPVHLLLGA